MSATEMVAVWPLSTAILVWLGLVAVVAVVGFWLAVRS